MGYTIGRQISRVLRRTRRVEVRRIKTQAELDAFATAVAEEAADPRVSWEMSAADYGALRAASTEKPRLGEAAHIIDTDLGIDQQVRLTEISRSLDQPGDITLRFEREDRELSELLADLYDQVGDYAGMTSTLPADKVNLENLPYDDVQEALEDLTESGGPDGTAVRLGRIAEQTSAGPDQYTVNLADTRDRRLTGDQVTNAIVPGSNPATSIADAGISDSDTTILVESSTEFPAEGAALIEDEVITYEGKGAGELVNATRGCVGTSAAAHNGGSLVIFVTLSTELSADLTDSATTISVDSTDGFPSKGTLLIGTEQITYTGSTGTTFTGCTRGANSTDAAAHADEAKVIKVTSSQTTTLAANYTAGDPTLELSSVAGFTAPGLVTIQANDLYFSGISSPNLTGIVGGQRGTTDANHNIGETVTDSTPVAVSALTADVNASNTVFYLADATRFADNGEAWVESEKIRWSSKTGTTLNAVERGIDGTSAASHVTGKAVLSIEDTLALTGFDPGDEVALSVPGTAAEKLGKRPIILTQPATTATGGTTIIESEIRTWTGTGFSSDL